MTEKNSDKIQVIDFQQQYASDFIAVQRKTGLLEDKIPDEQALHYIENADYAVIALKNGTLVGGFTLFCSSPNEVFWTDFFTVPGLQKGRLETIQALLFKVIDIMETNHIHWLLLTPGDQMLRRLYKFGGAFPLSDYIMGMPIGLLQEISRETKDRSLFLLKPARFVLKDNRIELSTISSLIRIDLKSGFTQYSLKKQPDKWYDHKRRCGKVYCLNKDDYTQYQVHGPLTDLILFPEIGHIYFPTVDLLLRSPWWSKAPAVGIITPAHDNDPCEITQEGNNSHILRWHPYKASKIKSHQLAIEHAEAESCTLVFSSLSDYEYLRLFFEFNGKAKHRDNFYIFGDLKFSFYPNREDMKGYRSFYDNYSSRLHLFFKNKEVKVTIKRINK